MNKITTHEHHAEVHLAGEKFPGLIAVIDIEDVDLVSKGLWRAVITQSDEARANKIQLNPYVTCYRRQGVYEGFPRNVYLHRLLVGATDRSIQVDHINHDTLDNRKANLRLVTHQQKHFNRRPRANSSSRFKGVSWSAANKKWAAQIGHNGSVRALGLFDVEIDAAVAYDKAAQELFGQYAYLNFPLEAAR